VRANLRHWDPEAMRLVVERPLFFQRNTRRIPWEVVLVVDQSGSMVGSVIHSAVMAGILAGLPSYRLRLVVFDTSVVDLTDVAEDPVELLMSVQLGGGTDIAQAMTYAEQLIDNPARSVVVLVTDFCEGGPPSGLVAAVRRLVEARVTTIGLASLDGSEHPPYDKQMAQRLADVGMSIGALAAEHARRQSSDRPHDRDTDERWARSWTVQLVVGPLHAQRRGVGSVEALERA
jgi:Mg-chelatase subunit ChlD